MTDWLFPALCGLLTGILSSWGVGGTLLLLCMTLFFGVEQRTAQAINLLYFLPTAGISLFAHCKNGYLDKAVLRAAIPTGTLCALAAAFLTTMVDSSVFRKPFGLFLLYAGLSRISLTTVDHHIDLLAQAAVTLLARHTDAALDPALLASARFKVECMPQLVVRSSTAPLA